MPDSFHARMHAVDPATPRHPPAPAPRAFVVDGAEHGVIERRRLESSRLAEGLKRR
jgi:hypothetical protein